MEARGPMRSLALALGLTATLLLVSGCGERRPRATPRAAYTFSLGSAVLFELDAAAEMLDTAPRLEPIPWATGGGGGELPQLSFHLENRILARFSEPVAFEAGSQRPTPFSAQFPNCTVSESLEKVSSALAGIARRQDRHTRIPPALATLESCALKATLTCFLERLHAQDWSDLQSATSRGLALKTMVSTLSDCTGVEALWQTNSYFEIVNGKAHFFPDPVYSIRIFAGEQTSYTWANDNLDSVAKIVDVNCSDDCYTSPHPMPDFYDCNGCGPLKAGETYTAFLQMRRAEDEQSFRRVIFKAPH